MKVLVTGHSGWIGSHIVDALHEQFDLYGVSHSIGHHRQLKGVYMTDITDAYTKISIMHAIPQCEIIVHCAASLANHARVSLVNCYGTHNIVDLAEEWGARIIYVSSIGVMGEKPYGPVYEYGEKPRPVTNYHKSKLYGEYLMRNTDAILRLAPPIGVGMWETKLLSTFVYNALRNYPLFVYGAGTRRQDYIDVDDIPQAIKGCIDHKAVGIFNIATGKYISNLDLAKKVIEILKSGSDIQYVDDPNAQDYTTWDININRARDVIRFRPTPLENTILKLAETL